MRKILSIALALAMCLSFAACGEEPSSSVILPSGGNDFSFVTSPRFNYDEDAQYATNGELKVELLCDTVGAEIFYSVDSLSDFHTYTDGVYISCNSTIYAYAEKDGTESSTVSQSFKVTNISDSLNLVAGMREVASLYEGSYSIDSWESEHFSVYSPIVGDALDDSFLIIKYSALGSAPQLLMAYVEDTEWYEVYKCIALDDNSQYAIFDMTFDIRRALGSEFHLLGQQVCIEEIYVVSDSWMGGNGDDYLVYDDEEGGEDGTPSQFDNGEIVLMDTPEIDEIIKTTWLGYIGENGVVLTFGTVDGEWLYTDSDGREVQGFYSISPVDNSISMFFGDGSQYAYAYLTDLYTMYFEKSGTEESAVLTR